MKVKLIQIFLEQFTVGIAPFTLPQADGKYLRAYSQLFNVGAVIPTSLDYRAQGKVSSIKNQGSCGCCWSFTTVGLYESFLMYKGEN